jgi:hypothetical protein
MPVTKADVAYAERSAWDYYRDQTWNYDEARASAFAAHVGAIVREQGSLDLNLRYVLADFQPNLTR